MEVSDKICAAWIYIKISDIYDKFKTSLFRQNVEAKKNTLNWDKNIGFSQYFICVLLTSELETVRPKNNRMLPIKTYSKFIYFFLGA